MNNNQNSNKFLVLRGLFLSAMLVVSILAHAKIEIMVSNTDSLKTKESRDSTIYEDFEFPAEFRWTGSTEGVSKKRIPIHQEIPGENNT